MLRLCEASSTGISSPFQLDTIASSAPCGFFLSRPLANVGCAHLRHMVVRPIERPGAVHLRPRQAIDPGRNKVRLRGNMHERMLPILHTVCPLLQFGPALPRGRWLAVHRRLRLILLKIGPPVHFLVYESLPDRPSDHCGLADDLVEMVSRRICRRCLNRGSGAIHLRIVRNLDSRRSLLIFFNAHLVP